MIFSDYTSPETRMFKAGLRQDPTQEVRTLKGSLNGPTDMHDKIDYERVNN